MKECASVDTSCARARTIGNVRIVLEVVSVKAVLSIAKSYTAFGFVSLLRLN